MAFSRHADTSADSKQKGYIIATTALLLIPLMVFAAFAVDVGAWYVEADQNQRAVDSAALAAVVHLPDQAAAQTAVQEVLGSNGYTGITFVPDGTPFTANAPGTQVRLSYPALNRVTVSIQTQGESYFGSVVNAEIDIERFASAEFNLPVPFGSPRNIIGYGVTNSPNGSPNYGGLTQGSGMFANHFGFCDAPHNGDVRGGKYVSDNTTSLANDFVNQNGCTSAGRTSLDPVNTTAATANPAALNYTQLSANFEADTATAIFPTHDPNGYDYVIEIPANSPPAQLWGFDMPHCTGNGPVRFGDNGSSTDPRQKNLLAITVRDATLTPLDDSDTTAYAPNIVQASVSGAVVSHIDDQENWGNGWYWTPTQPASGSNPDPGCQAWQPTSYSFPTSSVTQRYYVTVLNDPRHFGGFADARNMYALQVRIGSATTVCDSRPANPLFNANCPRIYPRDALVIRARGASGVNTRFFLGEIQAIHAGKRLEVTMYDPGEGMREIRFLDAGGQYLDYEWEVVDQADDYSAHTQGATNTCSTAIPCLDVSYTINSNQARFNAWSGIGTHWRFQGREVRISIDLTTAANGNPINYGWFEVEYVPPGSGTATDVTTWAVKVVGDPVRLTE